MLATAVQPQPQPQEQQKSRKQQSMPSNSSKVSTSSHAASPSVIPIVGSPSISPNHAALDDRPHLMSSATFTIPVNVLLLDGGSQRKLRKKARKGDNDKPREDYFEGMRQLAARLTAALVGCRTGYLGEPLARVSPRRSPLKTELGIGGRPDSPIAGYYGTHTATSHCTSAVQLEEGVDSTSRLVSCY